MNRPVTRHQTRKIPPRTVWRCTIATSTRSRRSSKACIADEGALGIELEHIIVREDGSPVNYSGEDGIQSVLEVLRADYPQATYDAEATFWA